MNTVFRRKSIQSGDMNSEDEFIKEKSLMSLQATPVSPGACAIQSHDSQSACWMVPCAPPKATAKLTLDQVYPSPEDKVRLKGGRTGISATSGGEKHLLQLRFLRNPTS